MISPAMMSSVLTEYFTPEEVLALVRATAADGEIGLDPCTSPENPCKARAFCTIEDDGLERGWTGAGLVYVNPPYGAALAVWALKIRDEAAKGAEIVACLPARTDTAWFRMSVARADSACFWWGRIKFSGSANSAPFPSVFAYFGDRAKAFRRAFEGRGWIP